MSAAFDSQAVAAKPLASLSSPERSHLKATLDKQHELIKGCFAEALAADGSYDSLVALKVAIVVNCETEQQYELDGEHAPDHARLRGDLAAAMAKAGPGGQAGAAWVGAFRAKYDAHDEAFDDLDVLLVEQREAAKRAGSRTSLNTWRTMEINEKR